MLFQEQCINMIQTSVKKLCNVQMQLLQHVVPGCSAIAGGPSPQQQLASQTCKLQATDTSTPIQVGWLDLQVHWQLICARLFCLAATHQSPRLPGPD